MSTSNPQWSLVGPCGQLLPGKPEFSDSGGSIGANQKLKGIDGRAPPGVELAA